MSNISNTYLEFKNKKFKTTVISDETSFNVLGNVDFSELRKQSQIFNPNSFKNLLYFYIVRNLIDDSYSIFAPRIKNGIFELGDHQVLTYNLNNRHFGNSYLGGEIATTDPRSTYFRIHRSLINDVNFENSDTITISNFHSKSNQKDMPDSHFISSLSIFPNHDTNPLKNFYIKSDEILWIKTLKSVRFFFDFESTTMNGIVNFGTTHKNAGYQKMYSNFLIIPSKISQSTFNENVADIYMWNDGFVDMDGLGYVIKEAQNNSTIQNDFLIKDEKFEFRSSSFTGAMQMSFLFGNSENQTTFLHYNEGTINNTLSAYHLGTLKLIDSSFYNYETRKTERGVSESSQIGEIIPFNFRGDYARKVSLGLSSKVKGVDLHISQGVNFPILDPFDGRVELEVLQKSNALLSINFPKYFKFDENAIKLIKAENSNKNPLSLEGLTRIAF